MIISTISETTQSQINIINTMAIQYNLFSNVEKLILIALLSSLFTFIFHKYYKTNDKVIYKVFNWVCSLVLIIIFDILTIVGSVIYRLDFISIIGEILQVIFIPFLSQCWYDWWKGLLQMIKEYLGITFDI